MRQTDAAHTKLPSGASVPVLGQGTWHLGERPTERTQEIAALQLGIDLGMTVIDTAEMYGDGAAERLVADAVGDRRGDVFIVSKVLPSHAEDKRRMIAACEGSLRRLRTEHIDLYLLHWRGKARLAQVVDTFHTLKDAGKILHWGVSNFNMTDLEELQRLPGGHVVSTDQILYSLAHRGAEYDLLPTQLMHGIPIMAYAPIDQGRVLRNTVVDQVAARHEATPAQVALAWVLRQSGVIAIPRASSPEHVKENRAALKIALTRHDLADLDRAFPPPDGPKPLEMI
ncbi:MAG: aldo/keto reductase [Steroidobacteraceae bacterium]